jgi:hypothetical protein
MWKKRDYDVPSQKLWEECLRVLKPWWYLLAFAGTRTQHRMAVRIEDAGFEIRDMIAWVYGSGFPKSLNIGKAINKIDGVEFDEIPASGVGFMNAEGEGGYNVTKNQLIQKGESSERAKEWEGWGTALKPALEPITVARKPLSDWWFDVAKTICLHILENSLYDKEIIWRIKNVKNAERQKKLNTSSTIEQQKMVEVSVNSVNSKEMQSVGIEIEKLLERMQGGTETTIEKRQTKEVELVTEQTEKEYLQTSKHINWKENLKQSNNIDENVSVAERQNGNFWPLTTQIDDEENIEKLSNEGISTHSLKKNDTQKMNTDCFVWIATSQWVCMGILQTIKISFNWKDYDFDQLSDGSFVWNENIKPFITPKSLNVAENVLKRGTGGINIDGCRVGTEDNLAGGSGRVGGFAGKTEGGELSDYRVEGNTLGRFPANLIHDGSDEVVGLFPNTKSGSMNGTYKNTIMKGTTGERDGKEIHLQQQASEGSASRFFYCAKASKSERNRWCDDIPINPDHRTDTWKWSYVDKWIAPQSNSHPTVKPIALMEYLVKLVSKEWAIVLDPFAWSGSTLVACKNISRNYIGMEMTEEYIPIIEARLNAVVEEEPEEDIQPSLF